MATTDRNESNNTELEQTAHDLSGIPATELAAELRRRQQRVEPLQRRYQQIMARAAKLRQEIEALGGMAESVSNVAVGAQGRLKRNETSLVNLLRRLLVGKTMSAREAAQAAIGAGYKTNAGSFQQIVSEKLRGSKYFEKVAPGRYTTKQS